MYPLLAEEAKYDMTAEQAIIPSAIKIEPLMCSWWDIT
jgi:hypothetical protein